MNNLSDLPSSSLLSEAGSGSENLNLLMERIGEILNKHPDHLENSTDIPALVRYYRQLRERLATVQGQKELRSRSKGKASQSTEELDL